MKPVRIGPHPPREVHQVGVPYHWGSRGIVTGDSANDLLGLALDRNVHISEFKTSVCDVVPGRRPRGAALEAFVEDYRRRAGSRPEARPRSQDAGPDAPRS
jgi:formate dehydrogenase major subunit